MHADTRSCTDLRGPLTGCIHTARIMRAAAKHARTVTGSAVLLLEGLQYTGLRSGSPDTKNVYAGTAGIPFPASPSSLQGAEGHPLHFLSIYHTLCRHVSMPHTPHNIDFIDLWGSWLPMCSW